MKCNVINNGKWEGERVYNGDEVLLVLISQTK